MVITNLIGGLGNQMFQYAKGRAASMAHQTSLTLDVSGFSNYALHQGFELQRIFSFKAGIADEADLREVLGWQSPNYVRKVVCRPSMAVFRRKELVVEQHFHYGQGIKNVPSDCYLTGYWQSEKNFLEIAAQIRKDFTFKLPMGGKNIELAKRVSEVTAVSLHVRRGDYVNNPETTAIHGVCTLEYYQAAIKYIAERIEQPVFFVFSDNIEWVKDNIKLDYPCQYVDHNHGVESYNDMRLMSYCQHHIIANSSFSWWAAWLNPHIEKIIIAPKRWFATKTDTRDLLPASWVKL
jgi:hypothetical protein